MRQSEAIEAVRQNIDIVQIIGEVVPLKKKGNNYFGCCPFHNEKTPSFSVSQSRQLFHCFGCKVGGDVFKFMQLYHRWEFAQILEELAKRAGVKIDAIKADPTWEEGLLILECAREVFEEGLDSKEGHFFRSYLKTRHIPERLWEDFHLGAHTGANRFLTEKLKSKGLSLEISVRLGLLGRSPQGDYFDRFQGRLMFPILDERGKTRGFGGRTLGSEHPKYINSPKSAHFDKSRLLYGMHLASKEITRKGYIVLVEGYLDVIALHEFGMGHAVGSMGTALTSDQIRTIKRYTHKVISLYDADTAGIAATEKNLGNFLKEGLEAKVVLLPKGKDPDAYLHDIQISPEDRKLGLRKAFENSSLALDYLVQNTVLVEKNALARGQKLRSLVNILNEVPDPIERTMLKKDLAKRFELPEAMLSAEDPASASLKAQRAIGAAIPAPQTPLEGDKWEREILKFLVKWGESGGFDLSSVLPYLSSNSKWASLLLRLSELRLESKAIAGLDWAFDLEPEVQALLREWALEDRPQEDSFDKNALWQDLIKGLVRGYFQRESERIQKAIVLAENKGDVDSVRKLLTEKQDLLRLYKSSSGASLSI